MFSMVYLNEMLKFESQLSTIQDINELKKMLNDNIRNLSLSKNMGYDKIEEICRDKIFLIKQRIKSIQ